MSLATAYRPTCWEHISGHAPIVKSIRRLTAAKEAHAFLLTGDAGLGKTSMARLIATDLGCFGPNLMEFDGSSQTGVSDWREVTAGMQYAPLGGGTRVIVIDECQGLSKQAWASLLKAMEEPPPHTYWILLTTEDRKISKAIRSRCASYELKPVKSRDLTELLESIIAAESLHPVKGITELIVRECEGSPRQAIAYLECAHDAANVNEAAGLISKASPEGSPRELAAGLVNGILKWGDAVRILRSMQGSTPAESIRRVVVAYTYAVALNRDTRASAEPLLAIAHAFKDAFPSDAKAAEVLLCVGRIIK